MTGRPDGSSSSSPSTHVDIALDEKAEENPQAALDVGRPSDKRAATFPTLLAEQARRAAQRFHTSSRGTVEEVIDIGIELLAVKDAADKHAFGAWMRSAFGSESRTADNYMQLARAFSGRREVVAALPLTIAYKLAAPTLPTAVREAVLERLARGPRLEPALIRRMISDAVATQRGTRPAKPIRGPRRRLVKVDKHSIEAARLIASLAAGHRLELSALLAHCNHGLGLLIRQALQADPRQLTTDDEAL